MTQPESQHRTDEVLLDVKNLNVTFGGPRDPISAVRGVSFHVRRGEVLAIVGESGSGKTVTLMSMLQLLPPGTPCTVSGSAMFAGQELVGADPASLNEVRGRRLSVVFQDALGAFNPVRRVGPQIVEMARRGAGLERAAAKARAVELLRLVGLSEPERRYAQYPHELSGGMRQRALIAVALAAEPEMLIADEPTTALDVTVQAQILDLLAGLVRRSQMATIMISHDLGVVAGIADQVAVMYQGEIVEAGSAEKIFASPQHPYTRRLLAAVNRGTPDDTVTSQPTLEIP